jgi:hypothetical protein
MTSEHEVKTLETLGPIADDAILLTCTCGATFRQESYEVKNTPLMYNLAQQVALVMKKHQDHIDGQKIH